MCFIVNGTPLARKYLNIISLKQYLMQTSPKQISMFTEEEFQSCQAASLANPTQVLESDLEKRMNATCGPKCLEQFEKFSHVGLWAKMFSALLIGQAGWFSTKCRLTWKLKGTKYNRLYFQLVQSTPHTSDKEFGSAPILPTPMAQEGGKITGKENQDSLTKRAREQTGKTSQLNPQFVEEMMGFPENWTASPFQSGETNPSKHTETQ